MTVNISIAIFILSPIGKGEVRVPTRGGCGGMSHRLQ